MFFWIYGRVSMNMIIEQLCIKLGLPKPKPAPYHLKMVNWTMTKPLGIIQDLKIYIHGIAYVLFIIMQNNVVDPNYSMLFGCPWLQNVKVTHD